MGDLPDPGAFGAVFESFMRSMTEVAEGRESEVAGRLRDHLGADPKELPTTSAEFPLAEHANLQLALDAVLADAELVGFTTRQIGLVDDRSTLTRRLLGQSRDGADDGPSSAAMRHALHAAGLPVPPSARPS